MRDSELNFALENRKTIVNFHRQTKHDVHTKVIIFLCGVDHLDDAMHFKGEIHVLFSRECLKFVLILQIKLL